jgi:stage II sporulation protein E
VTGRRFRGAGETKNVIGKEYETICFVQDTNYKTLTGMARVAKTGEQVSGDNFSFLELGTGELLMVLSDGMGSGQAAFADSANLIDILEDLLEVGFQKDSAIRMLNSFFVLSFEGKSFTTLDISSIDLYTGECEFLKNGAAATFIKRKDRIETFFSNALPVGVDLRAESTTQKTKLGDSDMIIMVTDGILDAFPGENKEFYIENILSNMQTSNPSEIANKILMQALERNAHLAPDDMSVLAAGIWNKC